MSDAEKRKSRESVHNSSDSEVSDSEFRNVAKKPKLSESRRSSGSPRRSSSSSSSSSSSGSGDEWENREAEGERSKVITKKKGEARSGPNSAAEEGEVSDSE